MDLRLNILFFIIICMSSCSSYFVLEDTKNEVIAVSSIPDQDILSIINPYKIGIDSIMNEVLCVSEIDMKKGKPESLLGNFLADLCLKKYSEVADICVMNNGGIRSNITKGNVTKSDIYKLMPFDNELVILDLNKEDFQNLLEYISLRGGEPFSGMKIVMGSKNKLIDYEISSVINFDKGDKLKVLTSDYLANGGDDMWFFAGKKTTNIGIKIRDLIIDHCRNEKTISSKLDNRLIQISE